MNFKRIDDSPCTQRFVAFGILTAMRFQNPGPHQVCLKSETWHGLSESKVHIKFVWSLTWIWILKLCLILDMNLDSETMFNTWHGSGFWNYVWYLTWTWIPTESRSTSRLLKATESSNALHTTCFRGVASRGLGKRQKILTDTPECWIQDWRVSSSQRSIWVFSGDGGKTLGSEGFDRTLTLLDCFCLSKLGHQVVGIRIVVHHKLTSDWGNHNR